MTLGRNPYIVPRQTRKGGLFWMDFKTHNGIKGIDIVYTATKRTKVTFRGKNNDRVIESNCIEIKFSPITPPL
jgi:hypothetical protein